MVVPSVFDGQSASHHCAFYTPENCVSRRRNQKREVHPPIQQRNLKLQPSLLDYVHGMRKLHYLHTVGIKSSGNPNIADTDSSGPGVGHGKQYIGNTRIYYRRHSLKLEMGQVPRSQWWVVVMSDDKCQASR